MLRRALSHVNSRICLPSLYELGAGIRGHASVPQVLLLARSHLVHQPCLPYYVTSSRHLLTTLCTRIHNQASGSARGILLENILHSQSLPRKVGLPSRVNFQKNLGKYGYQNQQLSRRLPQQLQYAYRQFKEWGRDPSQIVLLLLGTNVGVWMCWQYVDRGFMARHFLVSVESLTHGRWHTLITSGFSHISPTHLAVNMTGLYFMGYEVARRYGSGLLVRLYLAAAVVGSLSHVAYQIYLAPMIKGVPRNYSNALYSPGSLGASGAVNAIVLFYALSAPFNIIYLYMIIPVPAFALAALFIGQDLYGASKNTSKTSHAGHLGGALVGALFWARYCFRR